MTEDNQAERTTIFRQLQQSITEQISTCTPGKAWTDHLPSEEDRKSVIKGLNETIEIMFLEDYQRSAENLSTLFKSEERTAYALFMLMGMYVQAMEVYVDHCLMDADTLLKRIEQVADKP